MRERTNWPAVRPAVRADLSDTKFAYPPTTKNTGMTWRTHVAAHPAGNSSIGFGIDRRPDAVQWVTDPTQCHSTTTVMLTARSRST